jgi:hypothetical protein
MAPLPALAFDPLDALRHVFLDADPRGLAACFDASGRDINAAVQAYRAQQASDALARRLATAAGNDELCAGGAGDGQLRAERPAEGRRQLPLPGGVPRARRRVYQRSL